MRFGWLTLSLSPAPEEDAVRIDQQIEQVRFAEQLGFGDVWLTEHYFTGESVYNDALMFASAVAMRTERIRIGFAVVQLPFHHPVRLAVQLALLDNLSKGRIDVGVGKGTIYNEYEFVGHGLEPRQLCTHGGGGRDPGPYVARRPADLQRQIFSYQRSGSAPAPGAASGTAAVAQRHLAELIYRVRPTGDPDPHRAPAGGADQGTMGALRNGPRSRRTR